MNKINKLLKKEDISFNMSHLLKEQKEISDKILTILDINENNKTFDR